MTRPASIVVLSVLALALGVTCPVSPVSARCARDCTRAIRSALRSCRRACVDPATRGACRAQCASDAKAARAACRAGETPPVCGGSTTTTTFTTTTFPCYIDCSTFPCPAGQGPVLLRSQCGCAPLPACGHGSDAAGTCGGNCPPTGEPCHLDTFNGCCLCGGA